MKKTFATYIRQGGNFFMPLGALYISVRKRAMASQKERTKIVEENTDVIY